MPNPPAYWNDLTEEERAAVLSNGPVPWDYESEADFKEADAAFRAAEEQDAPPAPTNPATPQTALPAPNAQPLPTPRTDGWTAARQRSFLESLAEGHSVEAACRIVGMTHQSAYNFRRRAAGAAFALGWDAALLLARQKLADTLMVRAIEGQVETITRANGDVVERHRYDNRLASAMLTRLDRLADAQAREGTHAAARIAAQEFDAFLAMLDSDSPARAALFLYGRAECLAQQAGPDGVSALAPDLAPVIALARADRFARTGVSMAAEVDTSDLDVDRRQHWTIEQWQRAEASGLVQIAPPAPPEPDPDAASDAEETDADGNPQLPQLRRDPRGFARPRGDEAATGTLEDAPVWCGEFDDQWLTRFPPPPDFEGEEYGDYLFDEGYSRTLTDEEWAVLDADIEARVAEIRESDNAEWAQWMAAPRFDPQRAAY